MLVKVLWVGSEVTEGLDQGAHSHGWKFFML